MLPCSRCANLSNAPSLHSLDSGVFNSWRSYNRVPVVRSRTTLIFIMSDMNFYSSTDRRMVEFSLWDTIGLEQSRIRLDCRSVGCGEGLAAGGFTFGNLVVSFE